MWEGMSITYQLDNQGEVYAADDYHDSHHRYHHHRVDHNSNQGHCGAQGAILVEIYRETGDMLGLGLNRWEMYDAVYILLIFWW